MEIDRTRMEWLQNWEDGELAWNLMSVQHGDLFTYIVRYYFLTTHGFAAEFCTTSIIFMLSYIAVCSNRLQATNAVVHSSSCRQDYHLELLLAKKRLDMKLQPPAHKSLLDTLKSQMKTP
jgi:hypothetical protein